MKTAVYDNPATMCREMWRDGKMIEHISAELLCTKGFNGHRDMHFALNCGHWAPGRVLGDRDALDAITKEPS